ncbi:uncharacterized protein LOC123709532 [Pieris brassicae]|nr:uncharacterized protein LOC123709532 [Pieris brassicae]
MFRFSVPYPVLVDRFRTELNLTPPVDWNRTALFMETSNDFSALFISTNTSGRFRIVTNLDFYHDLPYTEMAIKLVKPFYVILLQCEFRFGYALAPFDDMPDEKHIDDAISVLGIKSEFNETYLYEEQFYSQFSMLDDHKNEDEYEDEEYLDDEL